MDGASVSVECLVKPLPQEAFRVLVVTALSAGHCWGPVLFTLPLGTLTHRCKEVGLREKPAVR